LLSDNIMEKLIREEEYSKPIRCSKCGKMLKYIGVGEYKCEACGFTEYDDYGLVRSFLEKNPGANIMQVETATGVTKKTINGLVKSGKLTVSKSGTIMEGMDE